MSIYIPGVKMPKEDGLVDLRIWGDGNINRLHGYNSFVVPGVKAFEVPPHGRLIDQDAILREVIRGDYPNQWIDKDELYGFSEIRKQSAFCAELMRRLNESIAKEKDDSQYYYDGMKNHEQKRNDIVRLRRELSMLHKMLDPWREVQE